MKDQGLGHVHIPVSMNKSSPVPGVLGPALHSVLQTLWDVSVIHVKLNLIHSGIKENR